MEDDDEFGDLYTDVLQPLTASFHHPHRQEIDNAPSSIHSRPIDLDDKEILHGASDSRNSKSNLGDFSLTDDPVQEKTLPVSGARIEPKEFGLILDSTRVEGSVGNGGRGLELRVRVLEKAESVKLPQKVNFMEDDDDDIDIVVEERDNKDDDLVEKDDNLIVNNKEKTNSAAQKENTFDIVSGSGMVSEQMIPGISGRLENHGGSNFEDEWESEDSEDDLQIVLNDNNNGPMGMERMPGVDDEDDEDRELLVILPDNGDAGHHHPHQPIMMDDQAWLEEGGSGADGERKELGDASKASGVAGNAAQAAGQPKIGYNTHAYHHPFHSQFKVIHKSIQRLVKAENRPHPHQPQYLFVLFYDGDGSNLAMNTIGYVRPGAAPMPGAAPVPPGGIPGQVRPPVTMPPVSGRGRGDWRPSGIRGAAPMQKGFHPGYGMPAWGVNSAGRGYGSGLDFTLPSHKTIFEVEIDSFEEKPWKLPGIDISDFFNFGLNEDTWKDYCKQLEQLRIETTMQSKIRVYESGRVEQSYDPDLPPELAAAAGIQDIPSESTNPGKIDAGPTESARYSARGRPPLPIGRPIPVETGNGDRLPSADTRRPRMHDIDAIIEVVFHSSAGDDDIAEQQDNDPAGEDHEEVDEIDEPRQGDTEHIGHVSHASKGGKKELVARREQFKNIGNSDEMVREDSLPSPPKVRAGDQPDEDIVIPHDARCTKKKGRIRSPRSRSPTTTTDQNDESFGSGSSEQSPRLLSPRATISDEEHILLKRNDTNDENYDMGRKEMPKDETIRGTPEDGNLMPSTKKPKLTSRMEQLSQENDDGEDSKAARSSETSKGRSGSSKDHLMIRESVEDEVVQNRRPPRAGKGKRAVGEEDNARRKDRRSRGEAGRRHMAVNEREDSYSRRIGDPNSSHRRNVKGESTGWRDSDTSEGSLRWRDEEHHGRRVRVEDTREMEHSGEIGSRNRGKLREGARIEKEVHHRSRIQLDNGSWRASNHDQDLGSRQRDKDDNRKYQSLKDDLQCKKWKEEAHVARDHAAKEDVSHDHRESSSRRKRERDNGPDLRKRDDQARLKDDDVHLVRQKEMRLFQRERNDQQRERDELQRLKQTHEEISSRREREESRAVARSGRATEDKAWINHSKGKDEHRGSSREYYPKDVGRHNDQLKRRDRVGNETHSQQRGHEEVYARGNQHAHDDNRARYERLGIRNERVSRASETSRVHENKPKDRKVKDSENGDPSSLVSAKRNQDEHAGQTSETVNMRGRSERGIGENEFHVNRLSSKKHSEDASSDDEQSGSRKGRSKLERWSSHKEKDLNVTSSKSKFFSTNSSLVTRPTGEPSDKVDDKPQPAIDDEKTGVEPNNANAKATEDKHLDAVAKLRKRSERFKLPMPTGKDAIPAKKSEPEPLLPSVETEKPPDLDIKPERPARKRRWTGN